MENMIEKIGQELDSHINFALPKIENGKYEISVMESGNVKEVMVNWVGGADEKTVGRFVEHYFGMHFNAVVLNRA